MGEAAALGTAVLWTVGNLLYARAGRGLTPGAINLLRLSVAVAAFAAVSAAAGVPWPWRTGTGGLWLSLSGVVGLTLGDLFIFRALALLGPRLSSLAATLWPAFGAVLGWALLGERLPAAALAGMGLTLGSIGWVAWSRAPAASVPARDARERWTGLGFSVLAALCQAVGFVLGKIGMGIDPAAGTARVDPLPAAFCRMAAATAAGWAFFLLRGRAAGLIAEVRASRACARDVSLAAVIGSTGGIWLSQVANRHAPVGVAGTLMATMPVWMIPAAWAVYGERPTARSVLGTLGAVGGVALLMLAR